jgi:3-oxoacyl-[acyl-carrier protein] reductase
MKRATERKCVVVTGAGRGIGKAVALAFAHEGFNVALWSRSAREVRAVAKEVESLGVVALGVEMDVAQHADVERAARQTIALMGTPRVVVNNAGVVARSLIEKTAEASWDNVLDVNLKGPFLVTRALLPAMKKAKRGRLVHIASISATLGTARHASYCASKWGLVGFMKSLAEELRGTGLQTLAVLPGSVNTSMLKGSPFRPEMEPEDVATTVIYAALRAPASMNGSAIEMFGQ